MTPPDPTGPTGAPDASSTDERALIERCLAGDAAAFEPLVERYRQRVWRLAFQLLRDREEAWDVAQEAFVRAFHSLAAFRGQSAFYTWLFRITVNVATDRQRARAAQARAFGAERVPEEEWRRTTPDPGAQPDQSAFQLEQRDRIKSALDALPPKARTIIMLSDVEGLSYREIAEVLRCPIGTVMSRLHNARKRLKALLGPMLAVLVWIGASMLWSPPAADAQQMIRFGVRVLQASNSPEIAQPPSRAPLPSRSIPPGPPPPPPAGVNPQAASPPPPPAGVNPQAVSPPPPAGAPSEDERFKHLLPQLQSIFRYSNYTTLERHRVEGPLGSPQRFAIPGERWLEVTPDELQGKRVRMRVRLFRGDHPEMNANILAAPGSPAVLGGPPHGNGVLIIILWAVPFPREQ